MRLLKFVLVLICITAAVQAAYVGKEYVRGDNSESFQLLPSEGTSLKEFFRGEIAGKNLQLIRSHKNPKHNTEHFRYQQFYHSIEVFGGEIIEHFQNNQWMDINGVYYRINDINCIPGISKDLAEKTYLGKTDRIAAICHDQTKLLIYPISDNQYRLAYQVTIEDGLMFNMTGIIDAENGELLAEFSNVWNNSASIGIGSGFHGQVLKFPTTYVDAQNLYGLYEEGVFRPAKIYTYDYAKGGSIPGDADNQWYVNSATISAHAYVGYIYDFYYLVLGRQGINNNNLTHLVAVNWIKDGYDNAMWSTQTLAMYFFAPKKKQNAAALDVIAHEYSHGVTQFSANLVYQYESGALNESFSDVMGAAVEHFWHSSGTGLLRADWYHGEDAASQYTTSGCRNLANPNTHSQLGAAGFSPAYPDPAHLAQKIPNLYYNGQLIDYGGVHLNSTIYGHAFYLLANGGTNPYSKKQVTGIGVLKATYIFYYAFINRLTRTSNFQAAANALLKTASSLYGTSGTEYSQTVRTMEAIGWTIN
jgi:Zn-dependent metalloprotease